MQRISTPTKALDLYGAGKHGFKDGNLASGVLPTDLEADWFNGMQEEALSVVEGAGLVPDGESFTQVRDAIEIMGRKRSGAIASATGSSDVLVGVYTPVVLALTNGLTVYLRASYANATATPTFTPKDGAIAAKDIVKGNGLALIAGDIAGAGHWLTLKYDLTLDKWVLMNPAMGVGILPASLVVYRYPGAGSVDMDVQTKLSETVSISDKGASLGAADNRSAIQLAIDDNGITDLYLPRGVWDVTLDPDAAVLAGVFGIGSVALKPRSNLRIFGPGIIRLKAGESGASGAIIGNWDGVPISNFVLDRITLDGNRLLTTGQVSGVSLVDATECGYEKVRARHMSLSGLQMRRFAGYDGASEYGIKDCWAEECVVSDVLYIGMQFQRPEGLRIVGNQVSSTGDNAVDVEGNNLAGDGYGSRIIIGGNHLSTCSTGIFMESVGNCLLHDNFIQNFSAAGMYFNRINSAADRSLVTCNTFKDGAGVSGVIIANSTGRMRLAENMFSSLLHSIEMRMANHVSIGTNYHSLIGNTLIKADRVSSQILKSRVQQQHFEGPRSPTTGKPFTCSPIANADNVPGRNFNSTVEPMWDLENNQASGTSSDDDYKTGAAGALDLNGAWGAYSIFFSGETLVYEAANNLTVGRYVKTNGVLFEIYANAVAGEFKLRSAAGVAGDFTATTNGSHAWVEYWPEWMTT